MSLDNDLKILAKDFEAQKLNMAKVDLRLATVENSWEELKKKIEALDEKLDKGFHKIVFKLSAENKEAALAAQKIGMLEEAIGYIRQKNSRLEQEVNKIKLGIAKVIGFGAAGGGLITGIIEAIKMMGN